MTQLRLIADDLTGALDSAAAFAGVLGPQRVVWREASADAAVFSTGTREMGADAAAARVAAHAGFLAPEPGRLSLFKLDSLLRGHAGRELDAVLRAVPFARVIIAPAFPFQGRVTRAGRLQLTGDGGRVTGEDIAATLRGAGHRLHLCRAGDPVPAGISLWDAETDADLDRIVVAGSEAGEVTLWVGSAGLAGALARRLGAGQGAPVLNGPLLGLIGTDHPVMRRQIAAVSHLMATVDDAGQASPSLTALLAQKGAAFATVALPAGMDRAVAQAQIAARFAALLADIDRPGTLFVSGGETLAGVAEALGADALACLGEIEPGLPVQRLCGGPWHDVPVVSKSGAFGGPDLLNRLLSLLSPAKDRIA